MHLSNPAHLPEHLKIKGSEQLVIPRINSTSNNMKYTVSEMTLTAKQNPKIKFVAKSKYAGQRPRNIKLNKTQKPDEK